MYALGYRVWFDRTPKLVKFRTFRLSAKIAPLDDDSNSKILFKKFMNIQLFLKIKKRK